MSNGWAQRKAAQKRDRIETAVSLKTMFKEQQESPRYKTKRERAERPATAEKRERRAIYGKFNPANPISDCCSMMMLNGECSGCGETLWWWEALKEMQACDIRPVDALDETTWSA